MQLSVHLRRLPSYSSSVRRQERIQISLNLIETTLTLSFTREYLQQDKTYKNEISIIHLAKNRMIDRKTLYLQTNFNIFISIY